MFPNQAQTTLPYRFVALAFGIVSVLLFGVVAAVGFTRATVTLHLEPTNVTTTVPVSIEESPSGERAVPGRYLTTTVTGSKTVTASGGNTVPAKAGGTVTISNATSAAQSLVAGTRLLSANDVLFRTTAAVTVPARGSVDVTVIADLAGEEGEIPPTTFTLPGLRAANQLVITGKSTSAMTGGTTTSTAISAADRTAALNALAAQLAAEATANLEDKLQQAGLPFTIKMVNQTTTPRAGTATTVSQSVTVEAIAYDAEALATVLTRELQATADDNFEVSSLDKDTINFTLQQSDAEAGTAIVEVKGTGVATLAAGHEQLQPAAFTDKSRQEIETHLTGLKGVRSFDLRLSPVWATKTPGAVSRVHVTISP